MLDSIAPRTASAGSASIRRLRVAGLAALFAVLVLAASAAPVLAWDPSTFGAEDEQLLFSLTNQDRVSAGLPVLQNDSYLHDLAEWRAKDMYDRDYFSHEIPPNGKKVFSYMDADGYCYEVAGENIGVSTYPDDVATTRINDAFMGSAGHRANILGDWRKLGVGAYKGASGKKLFVELFSIPCSAAATPKPTPVPTVKPTPRPTVQQTQAPTVQQTQAPTVQQTQAPTVPSAADPTQAADLGAMLLLVAGFVLFAGAFLIAFSAHLPR
jgi:uncharacterized protein YkwD